jgi:hypothetical protein
MPAQYRSSIKFFGNAKLRQIVEFEMGMGMVLP